MGEARDTNSTGGGRKQVVVKFPQGNGAGNSIVWVGNMGPFGVNGKEDRGEEHGVPANDHREESKAIMRWNMVDDGGRRHTRQREPSLIGFTQSNGRQPWINGWRYVTYLRYVQGRYGGG